MYDETNRTGDLVALLEWYREMGVIHVVDDDATDWRARDGSGPGKGFRYPDPPSVDADAPSPVRSLPIQGTSEPDSHPAAARVTPQARNATPSPPPPPVRNFPTTLPDEAAHAARQLAATARSLDDLRRVLEGFDGCALKATAKNLCFYRGAAQAKLMVIGEAPGREEDIAGKPFVGPAGELLDKMLAAIGLDETTAHITNTVYWRPPGNRTPTPQEGLICRPFLERQIELVAPKVVLMLGGTAAKHMLETPEGIMKLRGTWRTIEVVGHPVKAMASLHPAYLLRTPIDKRKAWQDLLAVKIALET